MEFNPSLRDVVALQSAFDAENFSGADCFEDKRRHVVFHLGVLLGKAARAEERADHDRPDFDAMINEVIPDLIVYAAQLSEVFDVDLADAYRARLVAVERRNTAG